MLSDAPRAIAVRMDVTEDGVLAEDIAPLPPERQRAEVLPGDRVELQALVVTADGPVDLDATEAAWFLCSDDCPFGWDEGVAECANAVPGEAQACLAGRGASPQLVLPGTIGAPGTSDTAIWTTMAVVSGLESEAETDACVSGLQARGDQSLQACAIGVRRIPYGPAWRMWELSLSQLDDSLAPEAEPLIPIEIAQMLPPNAAPEIERIRVFEIEEDPGQDFTIHDLSEPLRLPVGVEVVLEADPDPIDQQLSISPIPGVPDGYRADFETIGLELFSSDEIEQPVRAGPSPGSIIALELPAEPTSMTLWLVVSDGRGGRSWSRARLEVVAR